MIHLRSISLRHSGLRGDAGTFPFNLPLLQTLPELHFASSVTFLVGENGSGKSTLLEALACAVGSITVGSESVNTDPTLQAVRQFSKQLKLTWQARTRTGFFMRAEDFFGYAKQMAQMRAHLQQEIREVDDTYAHRSDYAKGLAKMPYRGQLHALQDQYGAGLDAQSHGEGFLALFQARFVPNGLYLLDEPEAPLSPLRQLSFLSLLKEMVAQQAQFIIATHSPILMAFPHATILNLDQQPIQAVAYEELETVRLMRDFLHNPIAFLQHL